MLQNPCKTLGFKKNMVYKIPPGGGGKPYPASGLNCLCKCVGKVYYPNYINCGEFDMLGPIISENDPPLFAP